MNFGERLGGHGRFQRVRLFIFGSLLLTVVGLGSLLSMPRSVSTARDEGRGNGATTVNEFRVLEGSWDQLAPYQRQALLPLRSVWPTMDATQREKWRLVASHFRSKSSSEQRRMHARMQAWVRMTPHQRAQARLGFLQGAANSDRKRRIERWAAYRELPSGERPQAAATGMPNPVSPALVHAASGATTIPMPQFFSRPDLEQLALVGASSHDPEYGEASRSEDLAASAGAEMAASAPLVELQRTEKGWR